MATSTCHGSCNEESGFKLNKCWDCFSKNISSDALTQSVIFIYAFHNGHVFHLTPFRRRIADYYSSVCPQESYEWNPPLIPMIKCCAGTLHNPRPCKGNKLDID